MQVQLLRQWSADVVYLTHLQAAPAPLEQRGLEARGIEVYAGEVTGVLTDESGTLTGVELSGGARVDLDVVFTMPASSPHDALLVALGAERQETPFGRFVTVDPMGRTTVSGVWAAGNVVNPGANVVASMAAGSMAAGGVNHDLVEEDVRLAVADYTPTWWEGQYRGRDPKWAPNPNAAVVRALAELAERDVLTSPGTALEIGAGHGADALWLAGRGWQVTATDVSETAVERIAARAAEQGLGEQVRTGIADATRSLPEGTFDLVYAAFTHLPEHVHGGRALRRALTALNPGGVLLLLDHGNLAPWMWGHGPVPTPTDMVAAMHLDDAFEVLLAEAYERAAVGPDGEHALLLDNVVAVRRRP